MYDGRHGGRCDDGGQGEPVAHGERASARSAARQRRARRGPCDQAGCSPAPIDPTIWSTPTPSAVSSTVAREVGCMPVTVGRDPCRSSPPGRTPSCAVRYAGADRARPPASRRRSRSRALPRRTATSCASGRWPRVRRASQRREAAPPRRRLRAPAPHAGAHQIETTEQQHECRQDARDEDRAAVGHRPLELGPTDGCGALTCSPSTSAKRCAIQVATPTPAMISPPWPTDTSDNADHAERREHERAAVGRRAHELCKSIARDVVDCSEEPASACRRHSSTT